MYLQRSLFPPWSVLIVIQGKIIILTSEFVKLEGKGHSEEDKLIRDCHYGRDAEIVVIQDMSGGHGSQNESETA